jgi:hypothetical protein
VTFGQKFGTYFEGKSPSFWREKSWGLAGSCKTTYPPTIAFKFSSQNLFFMAAACNIIVCIVTCLQLYCRTFTWSLFLSKIWNFPFLQFNLSIKERCAAGFALLNLPKGKSLGRSKPETNSFNEQARATHCVGFLLYPSSVELPYAK